MNHLGEGRNSGQVRSGEVSKELGSLEDHHFLDQGNHSFLLSFRILASTRRADLVVPSEHVQAERARPPIGLVSQCLAGAHEQVGGVRQEIGHTVDREAVRDHFHERHHCAAALARNGAFQEFERVATPRATLAQDRRGHGREAGGVIGERENAQHPQYRANAEALEFLGHEGISRVTRVLPQRARHQRIAEAALHLEVQDPLQSYRIDRFDLPCRAHASQRRQRRRAECRFFHELEQCVPCLVAVDIGERRNHRSPRRQR